MRRRCHARRFQDRLSERAARNLVRTENRTRNLVRTRTCCNVWSSHQGSERYIRRPQSQCGLELRQSSSAPIPHSTSWNDLPVARLNCLSTLPPPRPLPMPHVLLKISTMSLASLDFAIPSSRDNARVCLCFCRLTLRLLASVWISTPHCCYSPCCQH